MSRADAATNAPFPWLALVLASVFAVATLHTHGSSTTKVDEARILVTGASTLLLERPYLEPGPLLRAKLSDEKLMTDRAAHEQARERKGALPVAGGMLRREQAALDGELERAEAALAELPARRLGIDSRQWRPQTLLTYVALHSGVWHLAGNLLLLILLGVYLEPVFGSVRTALIALGTTLCAGLGFAFSSPDVDQVLIGSSGLLAGLLALFALEFRSSRSEEFYAVALVGGVGWLALPAWFGIGWSFDYPGSELVGAEAETRLVYSAYAGGVLGAFATSMLTGLFGGKASAAAAPHTAKQTTAYADLDTSLELRRQGKDEAAFQRLSELLKREPDAVDAALLLADVARSLGNKSAAESAQLHAVRIETKRGDEVGAVEHWLALAERAIPAEAEPALLVRLGGMLRAADHPHAASEALRAALERAKGPSATVVASRVAYATQEFDPVLAHDAAWRALATPELSIEERQRLEDLLEIVMHRLPGAEVMLSQAWEGDGRAPVAIDVDVDVDYTRVLDLVSAMPVEVDADGVHIATEAGIKKRVNFDRVDAIAVAAVQGLCTKPVLVIDLVLNWSETSNSKLRTIRLRSDKFDPRAVAPGIRSPVEALRSFVTTVLERSGASPLPDRDSALGNPFASFEELALYERTVLLAEAPASGQD